MIPLKPTPIWDNRGRGSGRIGKSGHLVIGKPKAHKPRVAVPHEDRKRSELAILTYAIALISPPVPAEILLPVRVLEGL